MTTAPRSGNPNNFSPEFIEKLRVHAEKSRAFSEASYGEYDPSAPIDPLLQAAEGAIRKFQDTDVYKTLVEVERWPKHEGGFPLPDDRQMEIQHKVGQAFVAGFIAGRKS